MQRVLRQTPATISKTFYSAGAAIDPGDTTVTVTRADGTELATGAVEGTGAVPRTFDLDPIDDLDSLTVTWESEDGGTLYSSIEVVGAFMFAKAELLADKEVQQLDSEDRSDAKLEEVRTLAEQAFENAASERLKYRVAYVPRFATARLPGRSADGAYLDLEHRPLRSVRSVGEKRTPIADLEAQDIAGFGVGDAETGRLYSGGRWAHGSSYTIGFEYGYDEPPERIRQAVLTLAKNWLVEGPLDDRATSRPAGDAGGVIYLSTPGLRGSEFGMPEVDAALPKERTRVRSVPVGGGHDLDSVGARLDFYG